MVLHQTNLILQTLNKLRDSLDESLQFGLLLAAFGHDLDHTGTTNGYEVRTSSKLALKYSDQSPLEYGHIFALFKAAMDSETNLFDQIDLATLRKMREIIIDGIVGTDMRFHF